MSSPNDELIDGYLNRDAVKGDTDFLEAELSKAVKLFEKANASKINLQGAKSVKGVSEGSDIALKSNAKLAQSMQAVISLVNQRFASEAKLVTVQTDYAKATANNTVAIQKQANEIKLQAQAQQSLVGSIDNMRAKVALLNKERNAESIITEKGRANIAAINIQIDKYNT